MRAKPLLAIPVAAAWLIAAPVAVLGGQQGATAPEDLSARPTLRLPDGQIDLSGTWDRGTMAFGSGPLVKAQPRPQPAPPAAGATAPGAPPNRPSGGGSAVVTPPERPKYKAEFQAKVKMLEDNQVLEDPAFHCLPPGVPRIGPPVRIVQTPREVVFLYDDLSGNFFRLIPTDGRPHRTDVEPGYLGDAVAHWEGDTLVVDTTNFNEETWLTDDGAFHTTDLRVVERLRRVGDTIEYNMTAYDPVVLAEPWSIRPRILTKGTFEIAESPRCVEKDAKFIVDRTHHDNPR